MTKAFLVAHVVLATLAAVFALYAACHGLLIGMVANLGACALNAHFANNRLSEIPS